MTSKKQQFVARASVLAVRSALIALALAPAAYAAEADDATKPTNSVEVGVINVDKGSYKFGEFNGLEKKGAHLDAGFSLKGGAAYDSDSTLRWSVSGANLGLDNRTLGAEFGEQGRFRINFNYDEIVRNQYDQYQTFYNGAGSSILTLRDGRLSAAGHSAALSTAGLGNSATATSVNSAANITSMTNVITANSLASYTNIQSPNLVPGTVAAPNTAASTSIAAANAGLGYLIPANMRNVNIGTQRARSDIGASVWITPQLSVNAWARQETKDGLKLTGVGVVSTGLGSTLPEPIKYTTNLFNVGMSWVGSGANLNVAYSGSFFKNDIDTWTAESFWANNGVQGNVMHMQGMPDNQMQKLKASGGYAFSKDTKLTVSASYARNTQDEAFIASAPFWYVPSGSAQTKTVIGNLFANLNSRITSALTLNGSFRYENRDSQMPEREMVSSGRDAVGTAGTAATASVCGILPTDPAMLAGSKVGGLTCYEATPINIKMQQFNVDADYKLARGHTLRLGYEWQDIKRSTDVPGENLFRAHETKEQTLKLGYRSSWSEDITTRLSYDRSKRTRSEYELHDPLGAVLAAAVEPILPNLMFHNISARDRDRIRAAMGFQASERLALNAGVDYNNDKYTDSTFYGKKDAKKTVLNLDASFAVSDTTSLVGFYSYEDQKQDQKALSILRATYIPTAVTNPTPINAAGANCAAYPSTASYSAGGAAVSFGSPADWNSDPCRIWTETQSDKVHTFGLAFKAKPTEKFDLSGALTYSSAKTPITFTGLQVVNTGVAVGAYGTTAAVNNNIWIPLRNMPEASSKMLEVRLSGLYKLDKAAALRLNYGYRKVSSYDAQWDAYAANPVAIQGYVGTGITSPNYTVNVVGAAYIYSFK